MIRSTAHRHSIFCILPPDLLHQVARNGSPQQRDHALATLALDHTQRALRMQARAVVPLPHLAAEPAKKRTILDAGGLEQTGGRLLRSEGDPPSKDVAADEAYDGLGATWDFYFELFGRNSIDGQGLPLDATVHYAKAYDNAFWNGEKMVFGDGDGHLFNRFTIALDVIAHELTHGVTDAEGGLIYAGQPGATNESCSDVFGALVKQRVLGQTAGEADWLIGEGLLAAGVQGRALRDMKNPGTAYDDPVLGKDPQPSNYRDRYRGDRDNGGVHTNSSIPSLAFVRACLAFAPDKPAWETFGKVWYATATDHRLRRTAQFARFAMLTIDHARKVLGSDAAGALHDAWGSVGVLSSKGEALVA